MLMLQHDSMPLKPGDEFASQILKCSPSNRRSIPAMSSPSILALSVASHSISGLILNCRTSPPLEKFALKSPSFASRSMHATTLPPITKTLKSLPLLDFINSCIIMFALDSVALTSCIRSSKPDLVSQRKTPLPCEPNIVLTTAGKPSCFSTSSIVNRLFGKHRLRHGKVACSKHLLCEHLIFHDAYALR